jgi:hypothetical protein
MKAYGAENLLVSIPVQLSSALPPGKFFVFYLINYYAMKAYRGVDA